MSTATAFKYYRAFPFCPSPQFPQPGTVSNLSLSDVMAFYWNLETFELTFAGTITRGVNVFGIGQSITAFPPAGTFMDQGLFLGGGMFPDSPTAVPFASLPQSPRTPVERVCVNSSFADSFAGRLNYSDSAAPGLNSARFGFGVSSDTANPGMYCVDYDILVGLTYTIAPGSYIQCAFVHAGVDPSPPDASGSYVIGGITFPWDFYGNAGDSFAGIDLSATSSSFTY